MLGTIQEYARQQLRDSGEEKELRGRHLDYYVNWAEPNRAGYWREGQLVLLERSEADMGNLRAAFEWPWKPAILGAAAQLVASLEYFLAYKDHFVEGYRWLKRVLAGLESVPVEYQVRLMLAASRLAYMNGELEESRAHVQHSKELARELNDGPGVAWSLTYISATLVDHFDPEQNLAGLRLVEEGLALFRELDDKPGMAQALTNLGNLARAVGDYARAQEAYEESLLLCEETGEVLRAGILRGNLSFVAYQRADFERAQNLAASYLRQMFAIGTQSHVALGLATLAGPLGKLGIPDKAARLPGASAALLKELGAKYEPTDVGEITEFAAAIRAQLGEADLVEAWAEGEAVNPEQAVAYAFAE